LHIHIYLLIQVLSNLGNPYGYILPIVVYRIVVTTSRWIQIINPWC